ncbi:MAG: HD domain-containing protein [Deltaproteobacteria bacterium]|nr:HD domain-containing protein [Deltaproteobacteria bacterium]
MVRFSDIIKIRGKDGRKDESGRERVQEDKFRLSDSQAFKKEKKKEKIDLQPGTPLEDDVILEVVTYYEKFIERAMDVRDRVKSDQGISPSPVLSDLHDIINKGLTDALYEYAMSAPGDYEEMLIHTIDVTFTSLRVGRGMGYDTKMLLRLGLTAFFENVGMYKIPDSILKRTGKLGQEEIKVIKKHPEISSDILGRMGERYGWLAKVALQIHERLDGSGYPSGLKGGEISELASIIGLIDIYVAMIKKRAYREKFIQTDAIKSIIEASKGLFPPRIIKVFLTEISLFPVNSFVKLNNKSIGRVISTDKDQPLRPTIELIYDGLGNKMIDRQVINLSDNPLLYIEGSVDENETP